MSSLTYIVGIILIVVLGSFAFYYYSNSVGPKNLEEARSITSSVSPQDVISSYEKDHSFDSAEVDGSNNEKINESTYRVNVKMGESSVLGTDTNGLNIELLDLKDGRCPSDVNCFWAGAILGKFKISNYVNPNTASNTSYVFMSDLGHSVLANDKDESVDAATSRIILNQPANIVFKNSFVDVKYKTHQYSLRVVDVKPSSAPQGKTNPKSSYVLTVEFKLLN